MILVEWDQRGRLHVKPGSGPPLLSDFLETDVQDYWPRIEEILQVLDGYDRGQTRDAANFYGNVYGLKLEPEKVTLVNLYEAAVAPEILSLSNFKEIFEVWVTALRSRQQ